ncbi:response regulator transcription factor [Pseudonocardia sp.]|uniref:LuxR C-terminal-related transcriptional regulator n=1 Tax=Pseudonocardia sp. TaxID=60912 RepID=UPI00262FB240|nr:response regulator transcription factor [Pseudonocardia sp.]
MTGVAPILIVDDHPLVAVALTTALREQGLDVERIDPAADGSLDAGLARARSGLVVLDLDLGRDATGAGIDGAELVAAIRSRGWTVLLLTGSVDRQRVAGAVAAGALGWLPKNLPFEEIVDTVSGAAHGRQVFDAQRRDALVAEHHAARSARSDLDRRWARLTPREREVLDCLVEGKRVADVARQFVVAEGTVRTQVRSILAKLEVRSQLEAVALARLVR